MNIPFHIRFLARTSRSLAVAASILCPGMAWGNCVIEVIGVNFGGYDVFASGHTDSTGNISVTCDIPTSYTLSLSSGNGAYSGRYLSYDVNTLLYNLYTDASRTLIWGDGSPGTGQVGGSTSGATENHTVYGRIPAGQNVRAGSYADSIIVTLEF